MVAVAQTRCTDCGRAMSPLGVPSPARLFTPAPQVATAGVDAPPRRRKPQKFICETCSTRRSTTNIVIALLLLGALLAFLWYDAEMKVAGQPFEAPVVRIAASPPPEAPADHAEVSATREQAAAPAPSRPRPARRRQAAAPASGPADLEGLY